MIKVNKFNDLMSRPILEALIEKKRLSSGEERPVLNIRTGQGKQTKTPDEDYVFDIPSTDLIRTEGGRGLLELASDEQDAQYIMAQMVLTNLGLIPKVYKSRRVNIDPSNAKKINQIKNLLENIFSRIKLDDEAPASILKELLNYTKFDIDNKVGFNTFDLLRTKESWDTILANLKKNIAAAIAGLSNREVLQKKISQDFLTRVATADIERGENEKPRSAADLANRMYGESIEDYDDNDDEVTKSEGRLTQEEKEKMFVNAYETLYPLYKLASQSGLNPPQYLKFQNDLDRVAGALKTNDIRKNLKEVEAKRQPATIGDYKDALIEAVAKSIKGSNKKMQVSNLIAKQATTALRWLSKHLGQLGYKGGINIKNIFDYIKNGSDKYAQDARYYLDTIYGITPEDLTTENYPNFKTFVDKLYKSDQNILKAYHQVKPKLRHQHMNLKRTEDKYGNPLSLVSDRAGGIGDSVMKIERSLKAAEKAYQEFLERKNDKFSKANDYIERWNNNEVTRYNAVNGKTLNKYALNNTNPTLPRDATPIIDFGDTTKAELLEKYKKGLHNAWLDYVRPEYKADYEAFINEHPEVVKRLSKSTGYIYQYLVYGPTREKASIRHSTRGSNSSGDPLQNEKAIEQEYLDDIQRYKNQLAAVTGKKIAPAEPSKKLSDLSDETPEGVDDRPYIVYSIDEIAPRLVNPIISTFKTELAKFGASVEWSTDLDDETGYLTIYYDEDGKIYNSKNPKKLVEDLRKSIQNLANKLGYNHVKVKTYAYEFAKDQYDSSGLSLPSEDEEWDEVEMATSTFANKNNEDDEEETQVCEHTVTFIPNSVRYPRLYLQNKWRGEYLGGR